MDTDLANSTSPEDDSLTKAYLLVAEKMVEGESVQQIRIQLMGQGFSHEKATQIITEVALARTDVANEESERLVKQGTFWCAVGLVVTAFTYKLAEGGGTYVVAYGAIIYGALQILQGLTQSKSRS